jgi:hypothetical protein
MNPESRYFVYNRPDGEFGTPEIAFVESEPCGVAAKVWMRNGTFSRLVPDDNSRALRIAFCVSAVQEGHWIEISYDDAIQRMTLWRLAG